MSDAIATAIQKLKSDCKIDSEFNAVFKKSIGKLLHKRSNFLYENTDEDKEVIFNTLYTKVDEVSTLSSTFNNTGKNLIYYSLYLSDQYVTLALKSLKSILDNTARTDFEVLFITDEPTKAKLISSEITSRIPCNYLITKTPQTGVGASINKLLINRFERLNEFKKILYLDCDVICIKDIGQIFDNELNANKLYVVRNDFNKIQSFCAMSHGLMYLTDKDARFIIDNTDVVPFNAGQFLFLNTEKMRAHFNNVRWLINVWPGFYFFEQSFMNHYFALNGLTDQNLLAQYVSLIDTFKPDIVKTRIRAPIVTGGTNTACPITEEQAHTTIKKYSFNIKPKDEDVLLHFAGTSLDGDNKIEYITQYINAYRL